MTVINTSLRQRIFWVLNYLVLSILALSMLYPFYYFLVLSLNDGIDAMKGGIYFWPRVFTFNNYLRAFENSSIINAFSISLFRTVIGTLVALVLNSTMAYALTKKGLPGRSAIVFYFFFTTLFSGGLIPYYILLRQLGLTKSVWIFITPFLYNFIYMVIMRTSFETIPNDLCDAAIIDGCGELRIYWTVYMRLSGSMLATMALFFGVMHWNDWFTGAMFITNKKLIPAATLLQQIMSEANFESSGGFDQSNAFMQELTVKTTPQALRMSFLIITTVPIVCVYPFMQKYFVKGVMLGSIKG